MLWIPITLAAAAFQTARNALQRSLTGALSALGATYTRFLFGFPFALLYAAAVLAATGAELPAPPAAFYAWTTLGGVAQITATALLLKLFQLRNFSTGIAFSKSEILQVAVFGLLVLGDRVTPLAALAIAIATGGLVLLSRQTAAGGGLEWSSMLLGLGTGAGFAVAAVAFRAASLSLEHPSFAVAAATTLAATTGIQTLLMTGWLRAREPGQVSEVFRRWRRSWLPGATGAAASACWFTAMTIEPAAHVRMLGLVEVVFGMGVAIFAHRQPPTRREVAGTALLVAAIAALLWERT
jgi:drug/metabolite transporter (DMT)-like permease